MRAIIPITDGDLVPVTYSLSSQPVDMAPLQVQRGLFLCSEHGAGMGHQRHKRKGNEQVEPLNLQRGPRYTLLAV